MFSFDDMTQIHCDLCLPVPLSSLVNGIAADDEKVKTILLLFYLTIFISHQVKDESVNL